MGEPEHPWHEHIWEKIPGLIEWWKCVICGHAENWNEKTTTPNRPTA